MVWLTWNDSQAKHLTLFLSVSAGWINKWRVIQHSVIICTTCSIIKQFASKDRLQHNTSYHEDTPLKSSWPITLLLFWNKKHLDFKSQKYSHYFYLVLHVVRPNSEEFGSQKDHQSPKVSLTLHQRCLLAPAAGENTCKTYEWIFQTNTGKSLHHSRIMSHI